MSEITFCQLVQGKQAQSSGSVIEVVGCTPASTTPLLQHSCRAIWRVTNLPSLQHEHSQRTQKTIQGYCINGDFVGICISETGLPGSWQTFPLMQLNHFYSSGLMLVEDENVTCYIHWDIIQLMASLVHNYLITIKLI